MVNVNPVDGITYGFRLIGYLVAVFIAGFIVIVIGGALIDSGGSAALVGGLVVLASTYVFTPRTQQRAQPELVKSSGCFERFA